MVLAGEGEVKLLVEDASMEYWEAWLRLNTYLLNKEGMNPTITV